MAEFDVRDADGSEVLIGSFWVPTLVKGSFTPGAAYTEGQCIGGLFTAALGTASEKYAIQLVSLALLGMTAGIGVDVLLFDDNPSASTFTDGATAVVNSADLAKLVWRGSVTAQLNNYASVPNTFDGFPRRIIAANASGNAYIAFVSQGGIALTGPHGEWRLEARN